MRNLKHLFTDGGHTGELEIEQRPFNERENFFPWRLRRKLREPKEAQKLISRNFEPWPLT